MTRPVTAQLIFVTATRLSQAQFESRSPLAQSLRRLGQLTPLALRLFADNRAALGSCYNQAIDEAPRGACLVFVHDDVFIDDRHRDLPTLVGACNRLKVSATLRQPTCLPIRALRRNTS
ncbi:MAG: hypothetical protein ACKO8O_09795, partial [Betaproteobacteria bacterium]